MTFLERVNAQSPEQKRQRLVGNATGVLYDIFNFKPWMVSVPDMATSLSKKCRWNGMINTKEIFSIAQHSVIVSRLMGAEPYDRLAGLLHDGSEAFMIDMISPMKRVFSEFSETEDQVQQVIYDTFGVDMTKKRAKSLHDADRLSLHMEANEFDRRVTFVGPDQKLSEVYPEFYIMNCEQARLAFIDELNEIMTEIMIR